MTQGSVLYDFREAINALAHSSQDAAALSAAWLDLCNTETPKDVTVALSSGETLTVPNLAKVIQSLTDRTGAITASSVVVPRYGQKNAAYPHGSDISTDSATLANGSRRTQHTYVTPYNLFHDASYMGRNASDSFSFFAIPRFVFFNYDSGLDEKGAHTIKLGSPRSEHLFLKTRTDVTCLSAQMTLINGDPGRTVTVKILAGPGASAPTLTYVLPPGAHRNLLVWAFKDGDTASVMEL